MAGEPSEIAQIASTINNAPNYANALKIEHNVIVCIDIREVEKGTDGAVTLKKCKPYTSAIPTKDMECSAGLCSIISYRVGARHKDTFLGKLNDPTRYGESPLVTKYGMVDGGGLTYSIMIGAVGGSEEENTGLIDRIFEDAQKIIHIGSIKLTKVRQ